MGNASSQVVPALFAEALSQEPVNTLISSEIESLTYEQFLSILGELNVLSKTCLDSNGKQLIFAVKKDTNTPVFWKATIRIACVKIEPNTKKIDTYRLLNLSQFLKVFNTLKCQCSAIEQSQIEDDLSVSSIFQSLDSTSSDESTAECCVCLDRKTDIILPCMHSYCNKCIEEWYEIHDTCPICREKMESCDDNWVLEEVPKAEEISKEMKKNLMGLTDNSPDICSPS